MPILRLKEPYNPTQLPTNSTCEQCAGQPKTTCSLSHTCSLQRSSERRSTEHRSGSCHPQPPSIASSAVRRARCPLHAPSPSAGRFARTPTLLTSTHESAPPSPPSSPPSPPSKSTRRPRRTGRVLLPLLRSLPLCLCPKSIVSSVPTRSLLLSPVSCAHAHRL